MSLEHLNTGTNGSPEEEFMAQAPGYWYRLINGDKIENPLDMPECFGEFDPIMPKCSKKLYAPCEVRNECMCFTGY